MACSKCGRPTSEGVDICDECQGNVRVLTPEEKAEFGGKTINADGFEEEFEVKDVHHEGLGCLFTVFLIIAALIALAALFGPLLIVGAVILIILAAIRFYNNYIS